MRERTLEEHLFGDGPKRILSIDGGGLRGLISLGILEEIEGIVGRPLSNYFDLIGGTSTGSFIAASLAYGRTTDEIRQFYLDLGRRVFNRWVKAGSLLEKFHQAVRPLFDSDAMERALAQNFGDVEMRSEELKTGLAIMAKRLDTDSPWILHNNPKGKYFKRRNPNQAYAPNGEYRVRDLVRASTAAPTFFEPTKLKVSDVEGAFVDGGVSPHNNPALQLLLLATLDGYRLGWPLGADKLLVVSVGTGTFEDRKQPEEVIERRTGLMGIDSLMSMMSDAGALNQLLLQWLSDSPTASKIDSEVGDLSDDVLGYDRRTDTEKKPWISYLRYNATLELEWLNAHVEGPPFEEADLPELRDLGSPDKMDNLIRIGKGAAKQVRAEHFPTAFRLAAAADQESDTRIT